MHWHVFIYAGFDSEEVVINMSWKSVTDICSRGVTLLISAVESIASDGRYEANEISMSCSD